MITHAQWLEMNKGQKLTAIIKYSAECELTYQQREMLVKSPAVVDKFFEEAHKIAKVRKHYSARTIIEVLRHNSALEDNDTTFKVNNMIGTPLSRISMAMFPFLNSFFETRSPTFKREIYNG